MKKIILILIILLFTPTLVLARAPKFKLHKLDLGMIGVNYSVNFPVVIDYDGDGDRDILVMTKEGDLYFLENLEIE